jgi:hypothetical protein
MNKLRTLSKISYSNHLFQTDRKRRWHYTPPNIIFRITKNKELDKIIHFNSEQIFYQDYTKIKLLGNGIWQKGANSANPHSCWQKVYRKLIFKRNTIWISLAGEKNKKDSWIHMYTYVCVYPTVYLQHILQHKSVLESRININGACRKARQTFWKFLFFTCYLHVSKHFNLTNTY